MVGPKINDWCGMDVESLRWLLREARDAISPEELGLPVRPRGRGRRAPGLRHEDMDLLLGRSEGTYARLETGRNAKWTPELCRDVAELLRFTEEQWQSLWLFTFEHRPPAALDKTGAMMINSHWREVVLDHRSPAYVADQAWNLIYWNPAFEAIFPGRVVPANTMRWMMLSADGRRRLVDWPTRWAPQVLPQLRTAVLEYPENEVLQRLDWEMRRDPVAGRLYRACHRAYRQPDGDVRYLLHDGLGERVRTTIAYAEPAGRPGSRFMVLMLARPGFHPRAPWPGDE